MVVFITVGLVALLHGGLGSVASTAVAVDQGCTSGNGTGTFTTCAQVGPYSFTDMTDGDWDRVGFWITGSVSSLTYIARSILHIYRLGKFPRSILTPQASKGFKVVTFCLVLLSLLLAILDIRDGQIDYFDSYYDCSGGTRAAGPGNLTLCIQNTIDLQGDTYGFWNVWVKYEDAVLEGIFAW